MLPSSVWRIEAVRMYCAPTVWCVQPTEYTQAVVRSRPEFAVIASAISVNCSTGRPQMSATASGV